MSEGDVSLIQDEDVLRRMWQQTEDFSRKKEIRGHMYRLREERLRNMYSPEPSLQGKDLKELSNAGWNVESENSTTDNGHTKVRSVQANIEGRYDVEGGTGQFAAVDNHKQAVTNYQDDNTSLKRNQSSSNTTAHEQVVRQTDDGTQFKSTASSSTSTSKFEQVSSTKQETVPYVIKNEFDMSRQTSCDTNRDSDHTVTSKFMNKEDNRQTLRSSDYEQAELISRKVEYPDENTKIIVETRCLPDGTRVTSTRREFRAPVVKNSHTEQHSQKTKTEKSSRTSSQNRSEFHETSKKVSHEDNDRKFQDIVDHQKAADDKDFRKYCQSETYDRENPRSTTDNRNPNQNQYRDDKKQTVINTQKNVYEQNIRSQFSEDYPFNTNSVRDFSEDLVTQDKYHLKQNITNDATKINKENYTETIKKQIVQEFDDTKTSENVKHKFTNKKNENHLNDMRQVEQLNINNLRDFEYTDEHVQKRNQNKEIIDVIEKKSRHQTDYSQKKISNDWSHTHQAWANTLRADTPPTTRPTTRASSPGSKTFKSSNSSLRSSVSPDKSHKKAPSRGESPNKNDRYSPSRASTDKFSSHYSTTTTTSTETQKNRRTSPEKRHPDANSPTRQSSSPNRKSQDRYHRESLSPEKHPKDVKPKPNNESKPNNINNFKTKSKSPIRTKDDSDRTSPLKDSSPNRGTTDSIPSIPLFRDSTPENSDSKRSPISPHRKQARQQTPPIGFEQKPTPSTYEASCYPDESDNTRSNPNRQRLPSLDNKNESGATTLYSPESTQPRNTTPNRFSTSPNRNSEHHYLSSPKNVSPERKPKNTQIREPSPSKNKKPTDIACPSDNNPSTRNLSRRTSPAKLFSSPEKKPPERRQQSLSPERILLNDNKYSTITNTQKERPNLNAEETVTSPSPDKHRNTPIISSRSPSPSKRPIPFTTSQLEQKVKIITDNITNTEPAFNYDNSDKEKEVDKVKISSFTHTETKDLKSFTSFQEKPTSTNKETRLTNSSTKMSPSKNTSPLKSPAKDFKHKQTSDFINIEKETEETNKKSANKNHPRQLLTPSTSPTRKSNIVDKAPSTGQSSPTTSVSGFVYYSSPRPDNNVRNDHDSHLAYDKPHKSENMNKIPDNQNRRTQTPSKIPCRSPSPEKCIYKSKESLPRKSSLKKYPNDLTKSSPTENPPTDFRVSPTNANNDFPENVPENKSHLKSQPDDSFKQKPPLERRETYEERCRKILGMIDNSNKITTSDIDSCTTRLKSTPSSPSISPCNSPEYQNNLLFGQEKNHTKKKADVSKFINCEQEENRKITTDLDDISYCENSTLRETSPTKLQDIIIQPKTVKKTHSSTITESLAKNKTDIRSSVSPSKGELETRFQPDKIPSHPRASLPIKNISSGEQGPDIDSDTDLKDHCPLKVSLISRSRTPSPSNKTQGSGSYANVSPVRQRLPKTSDTVRKDSSPLKESKSLTSRTPSPSDTTQGTRRYQPVSSPVRSISPAKHSSDKTPDTVSKVHSPPIKGSKIPKSRTPSPSKKSFPVDKFDHNRHTSNSTVHELPVKSRSPSPETKTAKDVKKNSDLQKPVLLSQFDHIHNISQKTKTSESCKNLIKSEREEQILDNVQKSIRKLSPNRQNRTLDHKNYPDQNDENTNIISKTQKKEETEDSSKIKGKSFPEINIKHRISKDKDESFPIKLPSRSISPQKKSPNIVKNGDFQSSVKSRSISPRKPVSPIERQQSSQIQKPYGIKSKETPITHLTKKPASPTKVEKSITNKDSKKSTATKQTSVNKTTTVQTNKFQQSNIKNTEREEKRQTFSTKGTNNDDIKINRTASDNSIKVNKTAQKVKSKPEVKVNNITPTKFERQTHTTAKVLKSKPKDLNSKLEKPKSTTALILSPEDNDITIDVQLAKSSRESSPDHICPTPVNFLDDVGTPRLPDEVNEPDDDYRRRTHHTIHEAETIVDDIVEINEDDELFVKRPETENDIELDDCGNKKQPLGPNQIQPEYRTKHATAQSKYIDKKTHSDFTDNDFKSDECLLSVSEKVNKFAKGSRDLRKNKSPTRNIVDEYDRNTVYQDDYTKLSVNDKAHFFVETAEKTKLNKNTAPKIMERPDFTNVDDSLRSDDCLLSVSDKVNKFVKTAEEFLNETIVDNEKDKKINAEHDKLMKKIVQESGDEFEKDTPLVRKSPEKRNRVDSFAKDTTSSHAKAKDFASPNLKPTEKLPALKITSLRSSETVKKAKELFENISTVTQKVNETKTTKLTDIGVIKKLSKPNATVLHSSLDDTATENTDIDCEIDDNRFPTPKAAEDSALSDTTTRHRYFSKQDEKTYESASVALAQSPIKYRSQSPIPQSIETATNKTTLLKCSAENKNEDSLRTHVEKLTEHIPSYQRPTKTSQLKEETKFIEDTEVSSRRGSGKFGVELRRTSIERSTVSSERRRSVEHHQPCIEDIFDLDLLEQMLEKVVGYEQRRRIRSQIRIAKKKIEDKIHVDTNTFTKRNVTKTKSPERYLKPATLKTVSSERHSVQSTTKKRVSPHRTPPQEHDQSMPNGHAKDQEKSDRSHRSRSPSKLNSNVTSKTVSPIRQLSPDKKIRKLSPSKTTSPKPKVNRFNEYASAYMKRVGLNENNKIISPDSKTKKLTDLDQKNVKQIKEQNVTHIESNVTYTSSSRIETTASESTEIIQSNGKRTPSPDHKRSPQRKLKNSTERLHQRSPSPKIKRGKPDKDKTETIIKTVYDVEKKTQPKQLLEERPSWVTNRNLKKITSETRTYSNKKLEAEKLKYRAPSPSKVISKPTDVITSSYGPGPLDADGRPLFGIRALRNGATNFQVKGTVIRQEFHSHNGGEPEGTVSVTAYSTEPDDLDKLLQAQGETPSRIHGLAAITTTKKFGGDTGTTLKEAHSKEERSTLEQFTQNNRRAAETRAHGEGRVAEKRAETPETREKPGRRDADRKTVRQSSVKSLTEKYIKSTSDTARAGGGGGSYPKAGLILRSANMKDSVSSDSSAHAGLARTDSDHSLGSADDTVETFTTSQQTKDGSYTSTTTRRVHTESRQGHVESRQGHSERSFLDSNTKVTGVQDILTRMKNADIVIEDGDTTEDSEARALLNKFLGASVLMAGMQGYVADAAPPPAPPGARLVKQETVRSSSSGPGKVTSSRVQEVDLDQCWDERVLRNLLDECTDYELRRRLRARLRSLMAEQEACASAVTEALAAAETPPQGGEGGEAREEEAVTTVTSSVRRNSSEKTSNTTTTTTTTKTSKVTESLPRAPPKPVSPFAKFRQLEKQNSTNSPKM